VVAFLYNGRFGVTFRLTPPSVAAIKNNINFVANSKELFFKCLIMMEVLGK
jgi:hypothetical protein